MDNNDFGHAIDYLKHAWNFDCRYTADAARFLADMLDELLHPTEADPLPSAQEYNEHLWAYRKLTRTPRICWEIGDALMLPNLKRELDYLLLLPTNTNLDSSAPLVARARQIFGPKAFDEILGRAPASLGDALVTRPIHTRPTVRVCHLVCRRPHDATLVGLESCLQKLPARRTGTVFLLPLWGSSGDLTPWVDALVAAAQAERIWFQVMVLPEEVDRAYALEQALIRRGQLVGRADPHAVPYPDHCVENPYDPKERLARSVKAGGPLTPQVYANWVLSGVDLPPLAWRFHEDVITGYKPL